MPKRFILDAEDILPEQRTLENLQALAERNPAMRELVKKQTARLLPTPEELDATADPLRPRRAFWTYDT